MSWTILLGLVVGLGLAAFAGASRRGERQRMQAGIQRRDRALSQGSGEAQLQHPVIDLSRCLGCGTCVAVCPEDGVLELVHGQAMVVNGARCMGISACERECPVDAITVTTAVAGRDDIPAVDERLQAEGAPGIFLAGEVGAHGLIKSAIEAGTRVARQIEPESAHHDAETLDLVIVGAGPAGLACALEAAHRGLRFALIDQAHEIGGTVARYPRRKLVVTEPVRLPHHGWLRARRYTKEDLVALWEETVADAALPLHLGHSLQELRRDGEALVAATDRGTFRARNVCLAVGRRGTPRQLGIPGEDLHKVSYSLIDAQSFGGRRLLVVGGGNSAVETAIALAEQEGSTVHLAHRRSGFVRITSKNEVQLEQAVADGRIELLLDTALEEITPDAAVLRGPGGTRTLPNDEVFVQVGGTAPAELLQRCGVRFREPVAEEDEAPLVESGSGFRPAARIAFGLALGAAAFALLHGDYYALPSHLRPTHDKHALLRPGMGLGLGLGIASVALVLINLAYLLRRAQVRWMRWGSLQLWMTSHVATGVLALLCAVLHGAMDPRDTPGGHAMWALVALLITGAIGRYFYSWVPRAANGRELELAEVKARLAAQSDEWSGGHRLFRERARNAITALIDRRQWQSGFFGRLTGLLGGRRELRRCLASLRDAGREQRIPEAEIETTVGLARRAHRSALAAAHYEDLRGLLGSWRYLHRWVAVLMVVLVTVHVLHALFYGSVGGPSGGIG